MSVRAMRTLTKFTTFSTPDNSINMAPIDDALAEIESLEPGENLSYSKIADKYGVWRSTLTRRHKAKTRSREEQAIIQQKLSVQQEVELVKYIKGLTKQRLLPTREIIQNFALVVAKEPVSESWVTRFIN